MYKFTDETTIKRLSDGAFIPVCEGNIDYEQFKADVVGIGSTCVVGIDTVTTVDYTDARKSEYPPLEDQLDKIYHSGIDAWKTYRQALRDLPASASPKLDSEYELDLTSVTWPTEPS